VNVIRVRNVHAALPLAMQILKTVGVKTDSRNGAVRQAVGPVTTLYERPLERVMFWPQRDANPFFHFFESLWMLGGRNDVESVRRFAGNMENYSDDKQTFWGAYGYRWRRGMSSDADAGSGVHDQLRIVADLLRKNPLDRRCVLQMWDGVSDLARDGKDVPCNTTATFQRCPETGRLDLVVFCRSNDIVWGCYGANAVQFSTLLEYVAFRAGMTPGTYSQVSVNWHGYDKTFDPLWDKFDVGLTPGDISEYVSAHTPYDVSSAVKPYPLISKGSDANEWDQDLNRLLNHKGRCPVEGRWRDPFWEAVTLPILRAHDSHKEGRTENAMAQVQECQATDWRLACYQWLERRFLRQTKAADDGVEYPEALR